MGNEINERIRYYRKQKDVTQEELGKAIGMNRSAFSRMEREGKLIPVETIDRIAECLGIDPDLITKGEKTFYDLTPATPGPLRFEDPTKNNPFSPPDEPEVVVGYKLSDMTLSVTETLIINRYRNLSSEKQQEFFDFINNLKDSK